MVTQTNVPAGPQGPNGNVSVANSVTASALADNAVTTRAIQNGAVTSLKLGTGAVTAAQIAAGAVTTALRAITLPAPVRVLFCAL